MANLPFIHYVRVGVYGFVLGGSMETFMYYTGFYNTVTKKEAEKFVSKLPEEDLKKLAAQIREAQPKAQ